MLARIKFSSQRFDAVTAKKLQDFFGSDLKLSRLVKDENGRVDSFWSYTMTLDEEEAVKTKDDDRPKKLVSYVDMWVPDSTEEYVVDLDTMCMEFPGVEFTMRGMARIMRNNYDVSSSDALANISAIKDKFEDMLKSFDENSFNTKCNVHVSNFALINLNQVAYALDYCTESLQDRLNEGWRILAVCVQPDGRRPDYILGRYVEDESRIQCVKF